MLESEPNVVCAPRYRDYFLLVNFHSAPAQQWLAYLANCVLIILKAYPETAYQMYQDDCVVTIVCGITFIY